MKFSLSKKKIDFIFLGHPRYIEDYKIAWPFFGWLSWFLSEAMFLKLMALFPPVVVDEYHGADGIKGLMICTPIIPDRLVGNRDKAMKEVRRVVRLITRMATPRNAQIIVGLGGWWPVVSVKGLLFHKALVEIPNHKLQITTGHTVTVYSLISMVHGITDSAGFKPYEVTVLILGCGNIGRTCARFLLQQGYRLLLVDTQAQKLQRVKTELLQENSRGYVETVVYNKQTIGEVLSRTQIGICATSSSSYIVEKEDIPENYIFIDDSRPEAIPRFEPEENKYVLEGGLMWIPGLTSTFNFGFGRDQNYLGCLAESYIMSLARYKGANIDVTTDEVEAASVMKMDRFCQENRISSGQFKMGNHFVKLSTITAAMKANAPQYCYV